MDRSSPRLPARPELCAVAFLALAIALTRARHPLVTLVAYFAGSADYVVVTVTLTVYDWSLGMG